MQLPQGRSLNTDNISATLSQFMKQKGVLPVSPLAQRVFQLSSLSGTHISVVQSSTVNLPSCLLRTADCRNGLQPAPRTPSVGQPASLLYQPPSLWADRALAPSKQGTLLYFGPDFGNQSQGRKPKLKSRTRGTTSSKRPKLNPTQTLWLTSKHT